MKKKLSLFCACLLMSMCLAACSTGSTSSGESAVSENSADSSDAGSLAENTASSDAEPGTIGYVTGHGEMDTAEISSFIAHVQNDGYTWEEIALSAIPDDVDILILNAPTEDITDAELAALNAYGDSGRHLLLLMPAQDSEVRFKNLNSYLEGFCVMMDYNYITETDSTRIYQDNPAFLLADIITRPDNMTVYSDAALEGTPFLLDARSFHFVYQDNFSTIKIDTMLQTADTAIGEPCGGTEDDPLTYEHEKLNLMIYSRDEGRANACVVAAGANNFLTDTYYQETFSETQVSLVHSTLSWFMFYHND